MNFYPELGETALLGYDEAIHLMVQDIVNMMEARGDDRRLTRPPVGGRRVGGSRR